jgi:tRNA pseudouridine38/39 synthase
VLFDCAYADSDVTRKINDDGTESGTDSDLYHQLHSIHQRSFIYIFLDEHFLTAATQYHSPPSQCFHLVRQGCHLTHSLIRTGAESRSLVSHSMHGRTSVVPRYVPLLERKRLDHVDVTNERWRIGRRSKYNKQKTPDDRTK